MFIRRHSLFPLVMVLLSLGLVIFMYFAFTYEKTSNPGSPSLEQVISVDVQDYENNLSISLKKFDASLAGAQDDLTRLMVVEETLGEIVAMMVPAKYQSVHLELAVLFHQMAERLKSSDRNLAEELNRLQEIRAAHAWLVP